MIKLFTLKNLSDFSSDAVYKICLALEQYGLNQGQIKEFENYDELYFETIVALEQGEHIIVAAENEGYNKFKRDLISKVLLEEAESSEIAQEIEKNAGDDLSEIDMTGHCLVARDSICHVSRDGLYCGFTSDALLGKVTCVPLDFMRIDRVINAFRQDVLATLGAQGDGAASAMPDFDFLPYIGDMVTNLRKADASMALATSEATMWIYNHYDKINGFNEALRFVEVVEEDDGEEATAESESVRVIRQAKEAMTNADTEFGAAISEIYSTVNENGQTVYFAYAAIVDKSAAKAKRINTSNPDDLALILPHAVTVLAELTGTRVRAMLNRRSDASSEVKAEAEAPAAAGKLTDKISKNTLIFGAIIIAIAIISPIIMVALFFGGEKEPSEPVYNPSTDSPYVTTAPSTTANNDIVLRPNVTEPTVGEITMAPTSAVAPSTSGTFTFDVFGYGHGVGLSQQGADWLAMRQGWTWTQILAHYYYCEDGKGQILFGDVMPETISYDGTPYQTREFLASVLEAEMGSAFQPEALKAQFVAIYTFAKYYGFDLNKDACAILGGGETPSQKVYDVVDEMMGIGAYIAYGDKCALTPFHSMSAGKTTSYYNSWGGTQLNYLSGARLSYGDTLAEKYKTTVTMSSDELKRYVEKNLKDESGNPVILSGDPSTWLSVISHDGALGENVGYVSSIRVGGTVISGNKFRINVLEGAIRSHCFYVTYTPSQIG
ncbi:MAG: hypothetical protein IKJ27_08420 [Clostridia bacterium]|nr:hypothetical protein [Clostridia bacterium]